jgi:hypothetical protein
MVVALLRKDDGIAVFLVLIVFYVSVWDCVNESNKNCTHYSVNDPYHTNVGHNTCNENQPSSSPETTHVNNDMRGMSISNLVVDDSEEISINCFPC